MSIIQHIPLMLASGSAIRAQMLKSVGLTFSVVPSSVDEAALKARYESDDLRGLAAQLAHAKAASVAKDYQQHLTIGADQVCACEGEVLDKPGTREKAIAQLQRLSGKTHRQYSAVCVMRGDKTLWETVEVAELTMRTLSDADIEAYVDADQPLQSCGAYKFESLGRHLFADVQGDQDVIKGLPLVPLLLTLYQQQAIQLS